MLDSIQQVAKKELSPEDKKKEFVLIGVCFLIFLATYYISSFMAYFSFIGYIAAIAVVVYLYRLIKVYSYIYTYQIGDGQFSILQTEGKRNPTILCAYPLEDLKSISENLDLYSTKKDIIKATTSDENPQNRYLAFKTEEGLSIVALTPNARLLNCLSDVLTLSKEDKGKEE